MSIGIGQTVSLSRHDTPMHEQYGNNLTATVGGAPPSSNDDETLVDETRPLPKEDMIAIEDWSQTGRGSHVDFVDEEIVPLQQENFLGRGAAGDVHEVTVQGYKLAHKRMVVKRKLGGKEMKEIDILKRLSSHEHIIQLVGTYTHRQFLGLLMYPVAVCDMATFFEDVEAWHKTGLGLRTHEGRKSLLEPNQQHRLVALGYDFFPHKDGYKATPVYSKIGCLISATAFLHDQKIRHKDLKPSNILLSKDKMWLSDFGSATDFSLLSQSATDNERGTPRYFSPEVAAWQPNGRAADVFSLGCVLLEILILHHQGTLQFMRQNRCADPSFHANTKNVTAWLRGQQHPLPGVQDPRQWSSRRVRLIDEVRAMLDHDPQKRPTARQLMIRTTGYDLAHRISSDHSIFGECCRSDFVSNKEHNQKLAAYNTQISVLKRNLTHAHELNGRMQQDMNSRVNQRVAKTIEARADEFKIRTDEFKTEMEERRQGNRMLHVAMRTERAKQHQSEMEYNRDRDMWLEEKRKLSHRLAHLEAKAYVQKDQMVASKDSRAPDASRDIAADVDDEQSSESRVKASAADKSTEEGFAQLSDLLMIMGALQEKRSRDKKRLRALGADVSDSDESTDEDEDDAHYNVKELPDLPPLTKKEAQARNTPASDIIAGPAGIQTGDSGRVQGAEQTVQDRNAQIDARNNALNVNLWDMPRDEYDHEYFRKYRPRGYSQEAGDVDRWSLDADRGGGEGVLGFRRKKSKSNQGVIPSLMNLFKAK